jgi:hypothetical protein
VVAAVLFLLVLWGNLAVAGFMWDDFVPVGGTIGVTYSPSQPVVGRPVTFFLGKGCIDNYLCTISIPSDTRYGDLVIQGYVAVSGSQSWITWREDYHKGPATVVFPYSGRFHLEFTTECWRGSLEMGNVERYRLVGSVDVTVAPVASTLPADVFRLGDYLLREVSLLQCVSLYDRPYTAIIVATAASDKVVALPSVVIDTGADNSFFPVWVAEALGIDLSRCKQGVSIGVGGTTPTYVAEVYIAIIQMGGIEADVQGYILALNGEPLFIKTEASFSTAEANADLYLLGRADVFDALTITFKGDTATLMPRVP